MRTLVLLALSAAYASAQMEIAQHPVVEFQMMTWAEVKKAIHEDGFINAVVYNGAPSSVDRRT